MSTKENTPVEPQETDLDSFSAEFFGQSNAEPEKANSEADDDQELEESDATNVDTHADEDDDTLAPDDNDDEETSDDEDSDDTNEDGEDSDDEDDAENKPRPKKKNRFQERIDELNAKFREEERQRKALEEKLNQLTNKEQTDKGNAPKKQEAAPSTGGPSPDDKNEDGTDKYPLGEYDPNYLKDFVAHQLETQEAARQEQAQRQAEEKAIKEFRENLSNSWSEKLEDARTRYDDFEEKGQQLIDSFSDLDQSYGEYLTTTLMSMDKGHDVLYYLSSNPDEAREIVNSGPTKATIALGRIEARFSGEVEQSTKPKVPKVSKAPTPPPQNKGSSPAKTRVRPDTENLDEFSQMFFKGS